MRNAIARKLKFLYAIILCLIVFSIAVFTLSNIEYVPHEPIAVSKQFLQLAQTGDFQAAHALTVKNGDVGRTLEQFESKIKYQLAIDAVGTRPDRRDIKFNEDYGGRQSYGNRLRRWLMGRKIDPEQLVIDYTVEGMPFSVTLVNTDDGIWRISDFQSHAG
jgi:hypothetical protein